MKPIVFHRLAEKEMILAARWYDGDLPGLGAQFLDEVDAGLARISESPDF